MSKIYLAGKITGDPEYREKFLKAAAKLEAEGHRVLNPAALPEGLCAWDYMSICLPMLLQADEIALLPDWTQSKGADIELQVANYCGIAVRYLE